MFERYPAPRLRHKKSLPFLQKQPLFSFCCWRQVPQNRVTSCAPKQKNQCPKRPYSPNIASQNDIPRAMMLHTCCASGCVGIVAKKIPFATTWLSNSYRRCENAQRHMSKVLRVQANFAPATNHESQRRKTFEVFVSSCEKTMFNMWSIISECLPEAHQNKSISYDFAPQAKDDSCSVSLVRAGSFLGCFQ